MKRRPIGAKTELSTLAAIVSEALREAGVEAVLSGGAVVSIYTRNEFESRDLDWITEATRRQLDAAMAILGFSREVDRYYRHPATSFVIESPPGPLMAGHEPLTDVAEHETQRV